MPFYIVRNDITNMHMDALVSVVNPEPEIGSGVDAHVHKWAGAELLEERRRIGTIAPGEAVITPGYQLHAKYVIHTVGPVWEDGAHGEEELLAACYRNALARAKENGIEAVALPLIGTGNGGFPKELALQIAIREFRTFLAENDMYIYLAIYDRKSFVLTGDLVEAVDSYLAEHYEDRRYPDDMPVRRSATSRAKKESAIEESAAEPRAVMAFIGKPAQSDIEDVLQNLDAGFSETLLSLIDESGQKDSDIYKKANIDRKHFSKIRNNPDYRPSKTTALAFAFALELSLEEAQDLIGRAGFVLTHCSKFDIIVEYFLRNRSYDIVTLNTVLYQHDQPLLGA